MSKFIVKPNMAKFIFLIAVLFLGAYSIGGYEVHLAKGRCVNAFREINVPADRIEHICMTNRWL